MERAGWNPSAETSPNCPRCGSCNTKFCYYNNYSLTQPRYFCKGCRRYWTKGGSLRNVPVGGGCRRGRSGKSINRLPSDHRDLSRVFPYGNYYNRLVEYSAISSHCHVFKNDHVTLSDSKLEPNNESAAGSNIDIAQVYTNFLNHQPERESHIEMTGLPPCGAAPGHPLLNHQPEQEARVEMTGLPPCGTARGHPLLNHQPEREARVEMIGLLPCGTAHDHPSSGQQFASVSNCMHMEFSNTNDHLPLENSLVEYPYTNNVFDSIHKQQEINTLQFTSDPISNYGLLPWLGELEAAPASNHSLSAPQMLEAAGHVGLEKGAQNSDHFVGNNYGNSVYTSTTGYGTLFRP